MLTRIGLGQKPLLPYTKRDAQHFKENVWPTGMISPFSSIKYKGILDPKIALPILLLLYLLSFNTPAYAADQIDKSLSTKGSHEAKVTEKSISITELSSLKVFYRQLEKRDRDASTEKLASLWQEYELLFFALVGPRNGNFYSYDAVRKVYSGEENILVSLHKTLLEKDRYAYKMTLLGYSAKEISDVINGSITVTALDTALKMRSRGHSEKEISSYLDSTYKKDIARQRDSIMLEKKSQGVSSTTFVGPPNFDAFAMRFSEKYGLNPNIIRAIVKAESNWSPRAVSRKGAIGLMQLMPGTALLLKVDPYDPEQNMEGGVRYFAFLLGTFKDLDLALIAYNAGPGYAERYSRGKASLYGETRQYVRSVKKYFGR